MINWKIVAIVFMVLFISLLGVEIIGLILLEQEENRRNECYYEICEEYPDAWLEEKVCSCYDYNVEGELSVVKTKLMK